MKRIAFFCWRPYQMMNIINFVYNNCDKANMEMDLYVLNYNSLADLQYKIRDTYLFNNVYVVEPFHFKSGLCGKIQRLFYFLKPKVIDRQCPDIEIVNRYDKLYASGLDPFFVNFVQLNKNASVSLLEDGLLSYLDDPRKVETNSFYKVIDFLFNKGPYNIKIESLYLYSIAFANNDIDYSLNELTKLNNKTVSILKTIFGYHPQDMYEQNKFIYFGNDLYLSGIDEELLKCIKDKVIYRKHPMQSDFKTTLKNIVIDSGENLWELLCEDYITDNSVLISEFSTAQFTPFLLYGKKPTIILTFKMTGHFSDKEKVYYESFAEKFRNVGQQKVYCPNSIDEFVEILYAK